MTNRRAFIAGLALTPISLADSRTIKQAGEGKFDATFRQYVSVRDAPFNAKGDGITDDTVAWNAFQASGGLKFIPAGRYLVEGVVKRFDCGIYGNGVFDDESRFTWVQGDRMRDSIIVHGRNIDANSTVISPVIKTQTKVSYNIPAPAGNGLFVRVVGPYHEVIGSGEIVGGVEGSVGNFTTLGAVADNRFAGLFGMTAITGRVYDAKESEVPGIKTHGASKSLAGYFPFERRSKYSSGGYMLGLETYCFWIADEDTEIPYTNNDSHAFTSFTVGYHCTAYGVSAPITDGILIDGASGANHGFYNGITIGSSFARVNNVTAGPEGTVGINLASWKTNFGDIGIKFQNANRHLHFVNGAKIRSGTTRFLNDAGSAEVHIEAASGQIPTLRFKIGATTAPNPTTNEVGAVYANSTAAILRSSGGNVQLSASGTIYEANTTSFAPAVADNTLALGFATRRWSEVFAGTGTINTSDAREKTDIAPITDKVLDAWGDVNLVTFRWIESVAVKGDDARIHSGLIAQQIRDVFEAYGLDAARYGLLCYDEWEAQPERIDILRTPTKAAVYEQVLVTPAYTRDVEKVITPAEHDENGKVIKEAVTEIVQVEVEATYRDGNLLAPEEFIEERIVTPAVPAGNRWGMRTDQCHFIEAAYQRRRADRIEARLAALELVA